ncbi:PaaI family thioesterase [Paenibacillus provencensis]|uniref:Acyl-coenzyme A thioesterase THEM4 n=1 Tax=Paenibacillus provencensis TaxID=441151 RepID=A0ABW3PU59_9BACL|nr:PaaI family thioesterase [Paenibacillus sp. MER 78]MCM3128796.1 PaaI family thioesterase [Paenibacillus sp. MER 78]
MNIVEDMIKDADERFWGLLGCRLVSATEDGITIAITAEKKHTNSMGIIHGGVLSSLMDQAMGMVAVQAKQLDNCVTTNLNIHYLAPMREGELIVTAKVIHEAGRSLTTTAEVRNAEGVIGCMATASFRLVIPKK